MRKRILGAAVLFSFIVSLTAASNMKEDVKIKEVPAMEGLAAGSIRFAHSFTTESDEATGITKNPRTMVASTAPSDAAEEVQVPTEDAETPEAKVQAASEEAEAPEAAESKPATAEMTAGAENRWNITLTQEEIDLLAKIVWLESQGEPTEGQEAVVEVVFNRMASEKYPDTLYDVLSQGNPTQFCSWKNRERANPTEKEYTSIHEVLNGNTHILRNDTLYFSTEPLTPRLDRKIGGHSFCY